METVAVKDLKGPMGDVVQRARSGQASLVTIDGEPVFVAVPIDESLRQKGVTLSMAIRLFADGTLTLARAARIAGLPLAAFAEEVSSMGIPVANYDPADDVDIRELEQ